MPGCDADYESQIAVDHHLPVCLRRLGAMKECPPSLPSAADNLPQHVSHYAVCQNLVVEPRTGNDRSMTNSANFKTSAVDS
jgi:hypothetical protein